MRFSRKTLGIPYGVFLVLFVIAPLVVLFYYAFTNGQGHFTLQNLTDFFTDPNTLGTLVYSLAIAAVTTLLCLLIAYPVAYIRGHHDFCHADVDQLLPADYRPEGNPDHD